MWIKTRESLPAVLEDVLVVIAHESGPAVDMGCRLPAGDWVYGGLGLQVIGGAVTHWQPLPVAPTEEDEAPCDEVLA